VPSGMGNLGLLVWGSRLPGVEILLLLLRQNVMVNFMSVWLDYGATYVVKH
jgi:hypothetical protein